MPIFLGIENISELLQYGERINLECKKAQDAVPVAVWETYSAFANTNGGIILLGIKENLTEPDPNKRFSPTNISNPGKLIHDFWNTINNRSKVNINILVDSNVGTALYKGCTVIWIEVPPANYKQRPIYINNNLLRQNIKELRIIYSNNSPCWTLIVLQGHFLTLYHPHSYFGKKQTELQSDIDAYADVIANVNADTMKSTKELKVAMLSALANWGGIVTSVGQSYYGSDYTAQTILDDSFDWAKLCTGDRWIVNYRSWGSSSSTRTSVSNFTEICSLYYERYQYLRTYEEKQLSTLQTEIEHKKLTKSELSSWSLKKLIDVEGDEAVFSVNVQANKLLVFMLRKGYIDEKYVSYVNYFNHYCFGICTTN